MSDPKDNKGTNDSKGDAGAAADKAKDEKPPKDDRRKVTFMPGNGGAPQNAMICSLARNTVDVAELEIRGEGGKVQRVQSVPRWNGQGTRPDIDVWRE